MKLGLRGKKTKKGLKLRFHVVGSLICTLPYILLIEQYEQFLCCVKIQETV